MRLRHFAPLVQLVTKCTDRGQGQYEKHDEHHGEDDHVHRIERRFLGVGLRRMPMKPESTAFDRRHHDLPRAPRPRRRCRNRDRTDAWAVRIHHGRSRHAPRLAGRERLLREAEAFELLEVLAGELRAVALTAWPVNRAARW